MPIVNGQYQAPTWVNGNRPAINATELQAMSDSIVANQNNINGIQKTQFSNFYNESGGGKANESTYAFNEYDGLVGLSSNSDYAVFLEKVGTDYTFVLCTPYLSVSIMEAIGALNGAGTTVGNFQIESQGDSFIAISNQLTQTKITSGADVAGLIGQAGASNGNYAVFAGGYSTYNPSYPLGNVFAINSSLTVTTPTSLSVARKVPSGASVGNYVLFAGGNTGASNSVPNGQVDAYNLSLTRTTPTALSVERYSIAAFSVGNYAVFAGGAGSAAAVTAVDAYNSSLTKSTPTQLPIGTSGNHIGVSGEDYGYVLSGSSSSPVVYSFNSSLTLNTPSSPDASSITGGIDIGPYAIFVGEGCDIYTTSDGYNIEIPPLSTYYFQGITSAEQTTMKTISFAGSGHLTGYIQKINSPISGYNAFT